MQGMIGEASESHSLMLLCCPNDACCGYRAILVLTATVLIHFVLSFSVLLALSVCLTV